MSPEPVLAERAYLLLKADIMAGRFAPGSILNERQLAAEYGVSVSPLRDAAQRLAGECAQPPEPRHFDAYFIKIREKYTHFVKIREKYAYFIKKYVYFIKIREKYAY